VKYPPLCAALQLAIPTHDPMLPYTLVLKPGLGIHSIYNGYWFWVGPRSRTCAATCAR
jgi:hypothetical protein